MFSFFKNHSCVPLSWGRSAPEYSRSSVLEPTLLIVGSGPNVMPSHHDPLHCGVGMSGSDPPRRFGYAPPCMYSASPPLTPLVALRQLLHGKRPAYCPDTGTTCPPHHLRPIPLRRVLCGGSAGRHGRRLGSCLVGSGRAFDPPPLSNNTA